MANPYPALRKPARYLGRPLPLAAPLFSATRIAVADDDGVNGPIVERRLTPAFAMGVILEPLEARQLMSVSLDGSGWTVITPAADSRVIYVSNSAGIDGNSGLSAASPVKTLARAVSLVRDNSADQILLKRGDAWSENFGYWKKSGRSAQEPMVISAYGIWTALSRKQPSKS